MLWGCGEDIAFIVADVNSMDAHAELNDQADPSSPSRPYARYRRHRMSHSAGSSLPGSVRASTPPLKKLAVDESACFKLSASRARGSSRKQNA